MLQNLVKNDENDIKIDKKADKSNSKSLTTEPEPEDKVHELDSKFYPKINKNENLDKNKKIIKGKPKTYINKYHKECREMILQNNKLMESASSKDEKLRLRNNNHSLL